ncbi:UvrD-helicase domain-containing protein, partial [Streptomyces sp. SID10244]|nr:UvrD-helicase domain-containing protein [Streptomyces sp. SID10244]
AEHLVDMDDLRRTGDDLYQLIETLPKGPRQRDTPTQALLKVRDVIDERRELIPMVEALSESMRAATALDFGSQMSLAARLVMRNPEVVAAERESFKAVLLDEYQD